MKMNTDLPKICLDLVDPYAICKTGRYGKTYLLLLHLDLILYQLSLQFGSHVDLNISNHHKYNPENIVHDLDDHLLLQHIVQAQNRPEI